MVRTKQKPLRVGIYAGTFDPVHAGHIGFALQALRKAKLDEVIFLPERRPRHKPAVEHFGHRVAMLKRALKPYNRLSVAEFVDGSFTVKRTLPQLRAQLPAGTQLVFLFGSDTSMQLATWPDVVALMTACEVVVAVRHTHTTKQVRAAMQAWPAQPSRAIIFTSHAPHVSSTAIRAAIKANLYTKGLLASVQRYAQEQWLYVSLGSA